MVLITNSKPEGVPVTEKAFRIIPMIEFLHIKKERDQLERLIERGPIMLDPAFAEKAFKDKKKKKKKRDKKDNVRSPILANTKKRKKKKSKRRTGKFLEYDPNIKTTTRYPAGELPYIEFYEGFIEKLRLKTEANIKLQEDITLKRMKAGRANREFGKSGVTNLFVPRGRSKKKKKGGGEEEDDDQFDFLTYDKEKIKQEYAKMIIMKERCKRELLGAERYYKMDEKEAEARRAEEVAKRYAEEEASKGRRGRRSRRTG